MATVNNPPMISGVVLEVCWLGAAATASGVGRRGLDVAVGWGISVGVGVKVGSGVKVGAGAAAVAAAMVRSVVTTSKRPTPSCSMTQLRMATTSRDVPGGARATAALPKVAF